MGYIIEDGKKVYHSKNKKTAIDRAEKSIREFLNGFGDLEKGDYEICGGFTNGQNYKSVSVCNGKYYMSVYIIPDSEIIEIE